MDALITNPFNSAASVRDGMPLAPAIEILLCSCALLMSALLFILGGLRIDVAIVLSTLFLTALTSLAWLRFDRGRHPCFLFLGTLLLFDDGRLIGYCLGQTADPLQIGFMTQNLFSIP